MIPTAEEFVRLRVSDIQEEYWRSAHEEAPLEVWLDVIARYPDMKRWVAHNKTVPFEILAILAKDADAEVRWAVAEKRKLKKMPLAVIEALAVDPDCTVRARIARRTDLPIEVIERLCSDQEEAISKIAKANLAARATQAASATEPKAPI